MKKFAVSVGRLLLAVAVILTAIVCNPGPSLAVATVVTGVLAYWVTKGHPWESAVFVYTALAWLCLIAIRWGFAYLGKMSRE